MTLPNEGQAIEDAILLIRDLRDKAQREGHLTEFAIEKLTQAAKHLDESLYRFFAPDDLGWMD